MMRRSVPFWTRSNIFSPLSFVSTWKTNNLSSGSSINTQVRLPLVNGGTYNFVVQWGDGSSNVITAWNQTERTHTYTSTGTYTIIITGTLIGFNFFNTGDRLKILDISQWGNIIFRPQASNGAGSFYNATNLNVTATDQPTFQAGKQMGFFQNCTSLVFNSSINNWNVSPITSLDSFFSGTTQFNQPLDDWDVSNCIDFSFIFRNTTVFNQPLSSWDVSNATIFGGMFTNAIAFNQSIDNWNVSNGLSFADMFNGATLFNQPLNSWNFRTTGVADIVISGMFRLSSFNLPLDNWNVSKVRIMGNSNSGTGGVFCSCPFNQDISMWDTSSVVNMAKMFDGNTVFDQDISDWNISACLNLDHAFFGATAFNNGGSPDINNWDTSSVTNINSTFASASSFNQPLNDWDVSSVTTAVGTFFSATIFNQPLNNWDMSNVTTMASMFRNMQYFNQSLDSWTVTNCNSFTSMFQDAVAFNQPLNSWILRSTGTANINMTAMFTNATIFNQPLNNWNVSKVNLFGVTNGGMFAFSGFNQDISMWDTSGATNMREMFRSNAAFNINIGSWNVSSVTDFQSFMLAKTNLNYSASNLDSIYNNWTNRTLMTARSISFGTIKYTAAATAARALLTRTNVVVNITNAVNNGSGLIRITTQTVHGRSTGEKIFISGVIGTTEANGGWIVTTIDSTTIDLQASVFANAYTSGGTVRTGYGWTVSDGGL